MSLTSPNTPSLSGGTDARAVSAAELLSQSELIAYAVIQAGLVTASSSALRDLLGFTTPYQQIEGSPFSSVVLEADQPGVASFFLQLSRAGARGQHRCRLRAVDGSTIVVALDAAAVPVDTSLRQLIVVTDLSPWLGLAPTGRSDSFEAFDPATGFATAQLLHDRATIALASARRYRRKAALLHVGLEHVESAIKDLPAPDVADFHGRVADTLRQSVRDSDTIARLNDWEYVILLPEIRERDDAGVLAARLVEAIAQRFENAGPERVCAAVGVAVFPSDGMDIHALMKVSEVAMDDASGSTSGRFAFAGATSVELRAIEPVQMKSEHRNGIRKIDDEHELLVNRLNDLIGQLNQGRSPGAMEQSMRDYSLLLRTHLTAESQWRHASPFDSARDQHKQDLRFLDELHCILLDVNAQSVTLAVHQTSEWLASHLDRPHEPGSLAG